MPEILQGRIEIDKRDVALDNLFTYHSPKGDQVDRYKLIRDFGCLFAYVILENTPICSDQSAAIRKVREAVMTANAAIACVE